jgi:hypothetical protein
MRYADVVDKLKAAAATVDQMRKAIADSPEVDAMHDLQMMADRHYTLEPRREDAWVASLALRVERSGDVRIYLEPGGRPLSADKLARAAEAARHIEAWVRGEIETLLPSGEWAEVSRHAPAEVLG